MAKISYSLNPFVPTPVVLVSCRDENKVGNIITLTWVAYLNFNPLLFGLAVSKKRYSWSLMERYREWVVNVPSADQLREADWCGFTSGQKVNKFEEMKFTPRKADLVDAPLIEECPINAECRYEQLLEFSDHDLFIGRVLKIHVDEDILNHDGKMDFAKLIPIVSHTERRTYWNLGSQIGQWGFSVKGQ